jgi:hypothetical protein
MYADPKERGRAAARRRYYAKPENRKKGNELCRIWYANHRASHRRKMREAMRKKRLDPVERAKHVRESVNYMRERIYGPGAVRHFEEQKRLQKNKCAICGGPPNGPYKTLNQDHCHKTGRLRGALCTVCNRALGAFRDSEDILASAIKYLKKWNPNHA